MFRIRRVYDDVDPRDREAIAEVQEILRTQFPGVAEATIDAIPLQLRDPLRFGFRTLLFVAERARGRVHGFALLLHFSDLDFTYLDFISAARQWMGGGVGGALYERVREESRALGAFGLFFESLPDDPELCRDPATVKQNAARLRFYERFGARPIIGTEYETPVTAGSDCPPYLVYDDLGRGEPLRREAARKAVRAILERKYGALCPPEYIDRVVASFRDDPVRLREPIYRAEPAAPPPHVRPRAPRIALVINEKHHIHHVRERGYVEAPVRIPAILRELDRTDLFEKIEPKHFPEAHIRAVHDPRFVDYLKRVCAGVKPGKSLYPYVFPIRNPERPPAELAIRAGYYCIDTFTPLNQNAFLAAKRAVDCALTAAQQVLDGNHLAYALIRPPGHHAEYRSFGGFCYFNSAAAAAHYLSAHGRVALLDIDYHHGNGQQTIFYDRLDVLTISIHGHPRFAYPYFAGFEEERGAGAGEGFNVNVPLPEEVDGEKYRKVLRKVLRQIVEYEPSFLVVSLGLDTAKGDPTGSWSLGARDFEANGRMVGALRLPTLVVQEGGYRTRSLGINARNFFVGLHTGAYA